MTLQKKIDLECIRSELYELIQTTSDERDLDSLETVVVRSCLEANNLKVDDNEGPVENTIGGWMLWLRQYLKGG